MLLNFVSYFTASFFIQNYLFFYMKEIIMFYTKTCLNSKVMMPFLVGMNFAQGKYKFIFADLDMKNSLRLKEKYKDIISETGEANSVPIFVDKRMNKAIYASNVEDLMTWLEGQGWWKGGLF